MRRIEMMLLLFAACGICGCIPGEAEFTLKTSEVLKALRGEMAQVSVHEKTETVLSNALRKVTFGGGKFTNQLDVVKALAADVMKEKPFDFGRGEWTNDALKVWVDEKTNALPCVKMEARLRVALGTKAAIEKYVSTGRVVELCALQIDPKTGEIEASSRFDKEDSSSERLAILRNVILARFALIERLAGKDEQDLLAMDQALMAALIPTWFKNLSCVIVGDSDAPLRIKAENITINGTHMDHFEGVVCRGETLRLELDKKNGGVRFFAE